MKRRLLAVVTALIIMLGSSTVIYAGPAGGGNGGGGGPPPFSAPICELPDPYCPCEEENYFGPCDGLRRGRGRHQRRQASRP